MASPWRDSIVGEIRRIREEYAARYDYDIEAICRAARERQATGGRKVMTLPPKPAVNGAQTASAPEIQPAP